MHDTKPRGVWKLVRITKLVSGQDRRVHGAVLKVVSPGEKAHTLKRPLQCLYPLEILSPSSDERVEGLIREPETENQTAEGECRTVEQSSRPMKSAAKKAQDNVKAILCSMNRTVINTKELELMYVELFYYVPCSFC